MVTKFGAMNLSVMNMRQLLRVTNPLMIRDVITISEYFFGTSVKIGDVTLQ
jgi:hypothetical protein